jgi:phenylalanyl-tRNA synthetase beta chain
MTDIDNGVEVVSALTDEYAYHYPQAELKFDKSFVDRYTGIEISNDTIVNTLESLGFEVKLEGDSFDVTVPSWRATKDVTIKADIIEEITRIYGYDNFDVHTAEAPLYPVKPNIEKTDEDKIKDLLVKRYSLHELHSYVWAYYDEYKALGIEVEDNIKLVNATNANIETIRRSIIPTQLCQVKYNTGYATDFGVFEIGRVADGVDPETNLVREHKKLAITLFSKTKSVEKLYMELRDMIAVIADDIKHETIALKEKTAEHSYQHPINLNAIYCGDREIGEIGIAHPVVSKKIDKKAAVVFAEIDVRAFSEIKNNSITYTEPSKYPEMEVDLTFVANVFAPIGVAIAAAKSPIVKNVKVVDIYKDETGKAITVRITFSDNTKTLTREEVAAVVDDVTEKLESKGISLKK